jgi:hypothetical protein
MTARQSAAVAGALLLLGAAPAAARVPAVPMKLPGDVTAASVRADADTWIVGTRLGAGDRAEVIAQRHGARKAGLRTYVVARARARAMAADLERAGLLGWAEPNRLSQHAQVPVAPDPLSPLAGWREVVAPASQPYPTVTDESPLLALVDSQLDQTHPEFAGGRVTTLGGEVMNNAHGTATAAVAAAPANGAGILGVWPGMRALNVPLPADQISCDDSARQIKTAVDNGAAVINMSYGSKDACFAEYVQLQYATAANVSLVAAAGNEFAEGNPLEYPASLPHVITVAAVQPDLSAAYFSNANAAVDLAAPGVNILTASPLAFDADGSADGWTAMDGTSFAAPIVAAAAAWLRAARPDLSADQVASVLRASARDIGDQEGWDPSTGFGLLDVSSALTKEAAATDPLEPNEDIPWIDGTLLGRADTPIYSSGRQKRLNAMLDFLEDPEDVYRVRIPARARLRISVKPRFGDVDLRVYSSSADTIAQTRRIVARSRRTGTRTDSVTLRNATRRKRTYYVRASYSSKGDSLNAAYTLTVRRLKW